VAGSEDGDAGTEPALDAYARLIADLDAAGARYRLIDHVPEGRTELVSALRGHSGRNGTAGQLPPAA
jgi:Ala-tRNA(Pro) deacylase